MNVKSRKFRSLLLCLAVLAMTLGGIGLRAADTGAKRATPRITLDGPPPTAKAPKPANKISSDTVVMKVNGEEVKGAQLNEMIDGMFQSLAARFGGQVSMDQLPPEMMEGMRTEALNRLKMNVLMDQAIKKMDYKPTAAETQHEWDLMDTRLKQMQGEDASFKAEIEKMHKNDPKITEEFVKQTLVKQLQAIKVVEQETKTAVDPKPDDIKKIFEQEPRKWGKVRLSHIMIKSQQAQQRGQGDAVPAVDKKALQKAQDILKEVKAGKEDFAALAKKESEDKGSAEKGGDLDFLYFENVAAMDPDFAQAAFKLKDGETSGLVQTPFGYHIIKVTAFKPAKLDDPDSKVNTRNRIFLYERNTNIQRLSEVAMENLLKSAKIEDMMPKPAAPPAGEKSAAPAAPAKSAPKEAKKK